jgi:hypothetical protein
MKDEDLDEIYKELLINSSIDKYGAASLLFLGRPM